jgi:hypothetical protein
MGIIVLEELGLYNLLETDSQEDLHQCIGKEDFAEDNEEDYYDLSRRDHLLRRKGGYQGDVSSGGRGGKGGGGRRRRREVGGPPPPSSSSQYPLINTIQA